MRETLFDPFRVSIMLDSNGANSTAAAAVLCASKHVALSGSCALVMGATVRSDDGYAYSGECGVSCLCGFSIDRSLSRMRSELDRCRNRCEPLGACRVRRYGNAEEGARTKPVAFRMRGGGFFVAFVDALQGARSLRVAVDLNAVPPQASKGLD